MKAVNPFDTKLEASKGMPSHFREAAVELTDTLDVCWAAAQTVFGKSAKPEHAIALLPMFIARADEKLRLTLASFGRNMAGELEPAPTGRTRPSGQRKD